MQLRRSYEPRDIRARIREYLDASDECRDAGLHGFGELNYDMAQWLIAGLEEEA